MRARPFEAARIGEWRWQTGVFTGEDRLWTLPKLHDLDRHSASNKEIRPLSVQYLCLSARHHP